MNAFNLSVVVFTLGFVLRTSHALDQLKWGTSNSDHLKILNLARSDLKVQGNSGNTLCSCHSGESCQILYTTLSKEILIKIIIQGKILEIAIAIIYYFCITLEFWYLICFYIEAIKMPCYTLSCNLNCT